MRNLEAGAGPLLWPISNIFITLTCLACGKVRTIPIIAVRCGLLVMSPFIRSFPDWINLVACVLVLKNRAYQSHLSSLVIVSSVIYFFRLARIANGECGFTSTGFDALFAAF